MMRFILVVFIRTKWLSTTFLKILIKKKYGVILLGRFRSRLNSLDPVKKGKKSLNHKGKRVNGNQTFRRSCFSGSY